ncbi:MAG: hypothetical protein ACE5KM_22290 [Planctomycetaceae bacterium]
MKKWLGSTFVVVYLTTLNWGIISHALNFGTGAHPAMYFVVWDMFCGWTSYSSRTIIVGQGESGRYYELAPGPWGEIKPFGSIGRRHYDPSGYHSPKFALNTLKQTKHEPITRVIVIEECWAKKYNLPDHLWNRRFEEPKDVKKYYQVRHVFSPDGVLAKSFPSWLSMQYSYAVANNPRLLADRQRGKPMFAMRYQPRGRDRHSGYSSGTRKANVGSRLGNGN